MGYTLGKTTKASSLTDATKKAKRLTTYDGSYGIETITEKIKGVNIKSYIFYGPRGGHVATYVRSTDSLFYKPK